MKINTYLKILSLMAMPIYAQVCDLTLTACPDKLPGGGITVPMDVISLDVIIPYCATTGKIRSAHAPSIMFVIDNSGSMRSTDPTNARFSVVNDMLDIIYAEIPNARVGAAIFTNRLAFDYRDNPFFKGLFPGNNSQHDSYIPLTRLDTTFSDGGTYQGVDTLKALLRYNVVGQNAVLVHGSTRPKERAPVGGSLEGTDITLGFDAAIDAMKASPSPKESQFIIFLSDGAPSTVDDIRTARVNAFEAGTNTPTTFTVYFTNSTRTVNGVPQPVPPPATIRTMTENIRNNGYSSSNPNSETFAIRLPGSELRALLQNSVLTQILTVPTQGRRLTVSVDGGPTQTTETKPNPNQFQFTKPLPLNPGTTNLEFKYSHTFQDTTFSPPLIRDTIVTHNLKVTRSPTGTIGQGYTKTCREQYGLSLFSGVTELTKVIASQINLEARLTPTPGGPCDNCTVEAKPSAGPDREVLPLVSAGPYLSAPFPRSENLNPLPNDGILQHSASDSIVLVWTNPENPLDFVRKAYPYEPLPASLELFAGNTRIDAITSDHRELEARLTLASGVICNDCKVQVTTKFGTDKETIALKPSGLTHNGGFIRVGSNTPIPGDGIIQHLSPDSIILVWTNPVNNTEVIRKSYPFTYIAPTLALFSGGKELDTVTAGHKVLEARLTLPSGEICNDCVEVLLSGSTDRENLSMTRSGPYYSDTFKREVGLNPTMDNGILEHRADDSIILIYRNPLVPSQEIRRSYPYIHFENIVNVTPHNTVAEPTPGNVTGPQWIISGAPMNNIPGFTNTGPCCSVQPTPFNSQNPDSIKMVGLILEASREFRAEVKIFSNLGEFVNQINFTVPKSEFLNLSPVKDSESRTLRLLWTGLTSKGTLAGTGAYIIKSRVTLLPIPGITQGPPPVESVRKIGLMRSGSN